MLTITLFMSIFVFSLQDTGAILHDIYWRVYTHGDIPFDAIEMECDGKYIGQVHVEKGLMPAMIYPHLNVAVAELYGKRPVSDHIKIMCTSDKRRVYWEYVDFDKPNGDQMKNAILGGYYIVDGNRWFNYYVGKAMHENEWKIGKVIPVDDEWKGLRVWDSKNLKRTVRIHQFYMLKYNSTVILPNGCVLNG